MCVWGGGSFLGGASETSKTLPESLHQARDVWFPVQQSHSGSAISASELSAGRSIKTLVTVVHIPVWDYAERVNREMEIVIKCPMEVEHLIRMLTL